MENWQTVLYGYGCAAIIAGVFFLIKIILLKKNLAKSELSQQQFRLFLRFIRILTVIFAAMILHFSLLSGDMTSGCPVLALLALLFIAASIGS